MIDGFLRRLAAGALFAGIAAGIAPSCADTAGGTDSSSHWLAPCAADADCAGLTCLCGVCTRRCDGADACSALRSATCGTMGADCAGGVRVCVAACRARADCTAIDAELECSAGQCVPLSASPTDAARGSGGSGAADAGSGGTSGRDAGSGGSSRDASVSDEGGSGGARTDASGTSDSARAPVAFFDGDAGPAPPSYCVPPCVWEVVKHCIPTLDTCVTNADAGPLPGLASLTCDPTTGWSEFSGFIKPRQGQFIVSRYGETCFRWDSENVFGFSQLVDWTGRAVALRSGNSEVFCGAGFGDLRNGPIQVTDAGLALADGGLAPAYPLDQSRPECAAWQDNGLPVAAPCTSTRAGVCR